MADNGSLSQLCSIWYVSTFLQLLRNILYHVLQSQG